MDTLITALAALGAGSVLTQYIGGSADRRTSRAKVLDALSETERTRWAPNADGEWRTAVRTFQTAALVARLPRDDVLEYLVLAQAARWASMENAEEDPYNEGSIDSALADATREAAHAISRAAWESMPVRGLSQRSRRRRVREAAGRVERAQSLQKMQRSREYGVA